MPNYYRLDKDPNQARIVAGLKRLREQLDAPQPVGIPQRSLDKTMRLATWNIREFDSTAYGERMSDSYYYLAEVISRFDLVAVQEVRRNLDALDTLVDHLGWHWRYLVTDTTEGEPGNDERLAFLYDTRKVRFSGLSGELVLPDIKVRGQAAVKPDQIVRTPFTAGFTVGWLKLQLATVHIIFGKGGAVSPERAKEVKALATFLAERADAGISASPNLVLLGDFNIFAKGDTTMTALTDAGWTIRRRSSSSRRAATWRRTSTTTRSQCCRRPTSSARPARRASSTSTRACSGSRTATCTPTTWARAS